MKRQFNYSQKEAYTQEDMDAILGQHSSFLNVSGLEADLATAQGELKPFKTKARQSHISGLVSDLTDSNKLTAAIKLAEITEDDDDEGIKSKVAKAIEDNDFLAKAVVNDPAGVKKETLVKKEPVKEQTAKEFQKEQRLRNI